MQWILVSIWLGIALALLVLVFNDALEAEDRVGFLRRAKARLSRVRFRSPVTLEA